MDIKTTVLGVLMLGEASGYEIRKAFEEGPFSHFADGGFGSIYPALTKLNEAGLATCIAHSEDKRPGKKLYRITEQGWNHLEAVMRARIPGEDKFKSDLLFILFFADHQEPDWIARVIDARIDYYRRKLADMADMECAMHTHPDTQTSPSQECPLKGRLLLGGRLVHGFGLAIYRASLEYLVTHRADFIAAARDHHEHLPLAAE